MPNVFTNPILSPTTEANNIDSRSLDEHDNKNETSADLATLIDQSKGLDRDAANRFWNDRLRDASSDQLTQLAQLVSVERKHVACVRAAHEHVTGRSSEHDHTKDTWYMVVTALVFSMHLKELVSDVMDDVIGDHVTAEPHHEAYFERTKGAPSDDNVLEMALDRLARNQQRNGGKYDWEQMERFLPKWPRHLADIQEELLQKYKDYCRQHSSLIQRTWQLVQ
ncbi:hypothetical protein NP493_777g00011 [Ridgeia piscesae]|uniref:Uncharacterized protein n=1 Tax=Ridgeia piscesae TaxID=27915 RepID=A0AAD9KNI8_RIDPI|nr:hypothetical protein NP493_777g00011 [Ridgeia piscesae]